MYKKIVEKYIKEAKSDKIVVCEFVKLAIKRHEDKLKRKDIWFNEDAANKFLKFVSLCKYTKGELAKEGRNIEFTPQQVFRYWCLFGWYKGDYRLYRKVYFEVARKNGKSEEAAVVCAYMLLYDKEFGADVFTVATGMNQARIVFDAAKEMIRKLSQDSAKVKELVKIGQYNVAVLKTNSKLEPLAANSDKQDGSSPHFATIDEYHAHPNSDLLEVIQTGMGTRKQPMLFIITTAGFEKQFPCYSEERKLAIDVLKGIKEDDRLFTVIFTLDEEDDWKDSKNWIKANPNIGITPTWEFMETQFNQAMNQGVSKEVQFKTKNLNVWTDSSMAWISDDKWKKCGDKLPNLKGRTCYGGLDLASTKDLNAFVLVFPPEKEGEKVWIKAWFWLPSETIQNKKEIANYPQWERDGLIKSAGVAVTNQRQITTDIVEQISKDYDIKAFAFDRYLAFNGVIQDLTDSGLEGFEFGQGYKSMSDPTKELERLVLSGKVGHGNNPILRWNCSNIEISMNEAGDIKMDKKKSREKIDGMVALVMALGCWKALNGDDTGSVYDNRGIIIL